jgi:hypothetical protein
MVVESFTGSSCFAVSELCAASWGSETTLVGFVADGVLTAVVAAAALESLVLSSAFARSALRVADLTEAVEAPAELDEVDSVDSVVWLVVVVVGGLTYVTGGHPRRTGRASPFRTGESLRCPGMRCPGRSGSRRRD